MPKYLFTSDQRISELSSRIKWVAKFVTSGHNVSEIEDKSDNNNATTLKFYYNLHSGTETCKQAAVDPLFAIRNFVLKFQFPNVRTPESLQNTISERLLLAPFRSVVSLLCSLSQINESTESYMTMTEILYFVFCNSSVYYNPSVNYNKIAAQIIESRNKGIDYSKNVETIIEWNQYGRQARELITVLTYASKCFKLTKGNLKFSKTHPDYIYDKIFIDQLLSYNKFWYPSNVKDFNLSTLEYISYMNTANTPYSVIEFTPNSVDPQKEIDPQIRQQIFYGAPGTGKSHEIKLLTKGKSVIRTTFHPDSDYSTFVGAYKPTMEEVEARVVPLVINNGINLEQNEGTYTEKRISYQFVKQAFLKAYLGAWKKYVEGADGDKEQFLIIEEINRGNCAQIFGDLFQLLDRADNGFSEYPIEADTDLQFEIEKAFKEEDDYKLNKAIQIDDVITDYISNYKATLSEDIQKGRVLLLPPNLFIWATMNTSDQSLFPIDSAFKRRWDWKYVPIKNEGKGWEIHFGDSKCDWWEFLDKINKEIASKTSSDDKKLGYFFCKPRANETFIGEERFVNKVLFYLWNDVFKDNDASVFALDGGHQDPTFELFFNKEDGSINSENVKNFITKLDVNVIPIVDANSEHKTEQLTDLFDLANAEVEN